MPDMLTLPNIPNDPKLAIVQRLIAKIGNNVFNEYIVEVRL
jgi:hypothetical protein